MAAERNCFSLFWLLSIAIVLSIFISHSTCYSVSSHICGFNGRDFLCCYGWLRDDSGECTIPHCPGGCGENGQCIRPDTCLCGDGGYVSFQCTNSNFREKPNSDDPNVDLPEVATRCPKDCLGRGNCVKGECKCTDGYEGPACEAETRGSCFLSVNRGLCVNPIEAVLLTREECCGAFSVAWGNPCHRCTATYCARGYKFVDRKCVDIDECRLPGVCMGGSCRNIIGSFECSCPKDYDYDETSAKCVYKPVTCQKQVGVCGDGGDCIDNADGTFHCRCRDGYVQQENGLKCVPRTVFAFNICQYYKGMVCQNGKCEPNGQSYVCKCDSGYVQSSDRKSCNRAIDVCKSNRDLLCQNGKCISRGSDFLCQCNPGYSLSDDQKRCLSYCDLYQNLCSNGRCIATSAGGYQCECMSGYIRAADGRSCEALPNHWSSSRFPNERTIGDDRNYEIQNLVARDTGFCSLPHYRMKCRGGDCEEINGSYRCHCREGFTRSQSGMSCDRYAGDEATKDKSNKDGSPQKQLTFCDQFGDLLCENGQCMESGSSYQCLCNKGFQQSKDGKICKDIDECGTSLATCGQGSCINVVGTYTCSCEDGYTVTKIGDDTVCIDVDECKERPDICGSGKCQNLRGSYQCNCYPGYTRGITGRQCDPVENPSVFVAAVKNCSECKFGCETTDFTKLKSSKVVPCSCPSHLYHVEGSGVCANINMVTTININLDTIQVSNQRTSNRRRRRRRDADSSNTSSSDLSHRTEEELTFDLAPSVNADDFIASLQEENLHVKRDQCSWLNLFDQIHVYCVFYYQ